MRKRITVDSRTPLKIHKGGEQIDRMVYELYGLTEEEIKKIVEES